MCCTSLEPKRCFGQGAAQLSINFFLNRNHVRSLGFFAVSSICVTLEWVDHLHLWLSESKQSVKMDRRKIGLVTLILATHVWHTGYIIMINSGPIPWKSLRQENVSLSTSEAKFVPASQTGQVAMCLRETLKDFAGLSIDDNHQNLWRHSGTCSHDWKTPNFSAPHCSIVLHHVEPYMFMAYFSWISNRVKFPDCALRRAMDHLSTTYRPSRHETFREHDTQLLIEFVSNLWFQNRVCDFAIEFLVPLQHSHFKVLLQGFFFWIRSREMLKSESTLGKRLPLPFVENKSHVHMLCAYGLGLERISQ